MVTAVVAAADVTSVSGGVHARGRVSSVLERTRNALPESKSMIIIRNMDIFRARSSRCAKYQPRTHGCAPRTSPHVAWYALPGYLVGILSS